MLRQKDGEFEDSLRYTARLYGERERGKEREKTPSESTIYEEGRGDYLSTGRGAKRTDRFLRVYRLNHPYQRASLKMHRYQFR